MHNSSDNCFKFKTNGEWDGLFTEYEDRTLSIRDLEIGNKITITCKADRAQLKFNDDTPNVVKEDGSPVSKDDIIENGSVYYVTAAGNLNLKSYRITDGNRQTYIQSITIEKGNGTVPTSETVGNPTIQQTGNTVTITPGVSSKEGSVKLLVSTSDADPTEVSLTDGKYTIDLSAEGNTGITTITAKTVSATTSTIASESVSYTVLAKPTIAYSAKNTITITGTSGSTIHYTTGEEAPTASSTAYSEALTYTEAATIKAIIAKDGNTSDVATFSLIPITADPTFANASVGDAKKVTITPATTTETSCTTFWSTDGNDPSTAESNENKFTESTKTIDIPEGCTIVKAITVTEAGNISSVASYNVPGTLTAPTITAASAISESGVTNTITITAEEGATIYHTTDGVAPTTESTSYTAALTQNTSATIKAIAVKDGATSSVATFEFKAIATAPTMERKGNHVIITAGATDGETNTATTTYQIGEGEEAAYSEPIVLTEANTTIKAITSTTSGNKIEVSQTFETVESVSTPSITISDKGIATITAGTSNLTGATVKTYYVTGEGDPTTVYDETNKPQLTDGQSIKAISVSEYDPSEYNVKSETASMTYTAPIPEAEGTKYDFTLYGDANGVLPTYGSDVTSGDQSLQMLAAGDNTFDNRFAVGLKRGDDAVFKFRNSDSYKGLYSQYDKRYLSILNLKAGDEVTVYMHAERAALTFSGTPIVSNASAGESVGNGTTYTVTSKGNLDFVTTGETYIEKIIINSEEVNAPSIVQTGDKVTITAGTVTPSYDGVKVKYTFAAEGEPDTEAASGAAIDIPANATVVSAVTVGKRSNSDKTSLTLLAKPEITAYTEGDAKNTIQIANANYYSTNYDGATALTISEGKPSGNGTWNAVTDGGIINTLTASSTVYAVKVDGNNISPVSAVYNFTYDTSVLPNAAAPTITASDNKVTITTIEEGATTTYYLGTETTGTTLETTSVTLEDLTASTTIKAVSAIEGKQDATTNFTFTYISTLPTITQGASSNEVAITIGNATLGEGEIITTTYQIGDAAAVGITENKTLTDLTADDNNKVITVTTTVTKDNTVTNSASVTLTFAYVAPVSDGKIDVTYDFTGFADKTNFTQADPLATADSDFDNRFAVSRITSDAGFWLRSYSDKTKGLYSRYADRTLTVKNLTAGDKVTINWHCDDSQNSDNDGKFVLTDGTDVVSGSPIVIAEDGDLTIKSAKGGTKDPCVTITSIIIHEAETLSAPTIAVNPENSNEVIITAGKTNNADATITTYYAITTDDTDPVPTTESTTNFTGSGAKETITLTQSIKIKAISVSSTESMDEQASEVKEFTYVAETLTAPTIKLALADNSVVITAGQSNNEEATVTTYYSLNGEAPTISETNEQKFTGESKELTLEADATIIAVSVSSTGKAANATSETFTFTYDAPDGKTRFNTTYDFTEKDGNPINQDAEHKVTSNGTSLFLLAYDENTNFDNRFAIGPDSRTGNGGFYFRNNNATYKGLFTGYDSRNFSVLNLKKGDKVTLTLSNNAETLKFVEGDVVLSGKAYTAKADGNMDFVTLTGGVYIEKVVIAEAEAVQAPTLTLSEDGTKVTIAAGASNNPEAIVSTYYTTTGSISFNDGKAVTEGLTKLTADNSVVTVVGTTNIEAIAISNGGAESIVTKGSYVEPVVESDSKTYSFIGYGDQTGVIPAYATETTSGGQTLYLLATGDEIFDNRFAVGPKREDANVFKFREDGIYKGLYSQYDKRYFSILDLKKGEKVTLTINGNAETLQFADAAKVLEMTGGANAAKVAEGAKVKSGTTYYINEDGNLDFVTTGSIYIESAKISVAVEDEELTVAETVSKPTITDNGDNTVSITAGVSDADKKVTTYYTTDGSVPTAE
ncbi:MAG: chitobiase/beta-hexosaminidase C-terminal domain-containing protein, partial [Prevotella sp.]|nr:chitobiase/beta-hexosaminidase C-terminal domain-containing protein [Prevotella sp.]